MDKDTLLFEMTLGEELPGILTRYVGASEKQRTVGYHNGVLQELKPGRRHTVADVWQTFVGDFACTWVAQMPCDPLAFAITLRANANDQLVDLTALLNVQVNDPVAFTRWVCYKVWGEGPYRATSLVFTTSDHSMGTERSFSRRSSMLVARAISAPAMSRKMKSPKPRNW